MTQLRTYDGYVLSGIIVGLGIAGARLENNIPLYMMLAVIVLSVVLVIFDRIDKRQYPILVYFICLGMVYQLSLLSNYVVGTDIHYEYYFALHVYNTGHWDTSVGHTYNTAISTTVILPYIARWLHIPLAWAFKVIPPLFLSGIPVVVYWIVRREFKDAKTAFLSAFFLISVPTMFLELSGLAKQAFAELFLIACLGLVVFDVFRKAWQRYVAIVVTGLLTVLMHYSMGGALFAYLLGAILLLVVGKLVFRIRGGIRVGYLCLVTAVIMGLGLLYYHSVAQGTAYNDVAGSITAEIQRVLPKPKPPDVVPPTTIAALPAAEQPNQKTTPFPTPKESALMEDRQSPTAQQHWEYPEPAVQLALGGDFMEVGTFPKIFRVFQYATEIIIITGGVAILIRYKRHSVGYLAMLVTSGGLLLMVAFWPGFSPILNASRFYNLALLFAAPAIVVGGELIFRSKRVLALAILLPYFIFTSGIVFEMLGITDLTTITMPYSHALSALRTDSTAVFTANDIKARDWVAVNDAYPVYGDMWGSTAVTEVKTNLSGTAAYRLTDAELDTLPVYVHYFVFAADEPTPRLVPDDCYIILRERNTEKQELTYYTGVGMRKTISYDKAGFNAVLRNRPIAFQAGDAIVYGAKEK